MGPAAVAAIWLAGIGLRRLNGRVLPEVVGAAFGVGAFLALAGATVLASRLCLRNQE